MYNLNSLYNFKNPIRHFFNLDKVMFDASENLQFSDLNWTAPVKFNIFKTDRSQRSISFPNILNFYHAVKCFADEPLFYQIDQISERKRVFPDLDTGEFSTYSYYSSLKRDIFNLTKYDKLLILDIKSFYGRIYTHDLGFDGSSDKKLEQRVSSLYNGRTNGLLLGSYLSLYLAELVLYKIEKVIDEGLKRSNIDCHYEYFSDDFYFFCNETDVEDIKSIFAKALESFELSLNYDKIAEFDFEEYTKNNNLEKLWKKIIKLAEQKDKEGERERKRIFSPIYTQLVYRLGQISELKYKRIFLANFFKTYYFVNLEPQKYVLSKSDMNYICYIYKLMPEAILYSLHKIKEIEGFDTDKFKDFVIARFNASLNGERQEEQVYFYYAVKLCGFDSELLRFKEKVLRTENQILISYYICDGLITKEDYQKYIDNHSESEWLQNYHYLLKYDKSNTAILIPEIVKKENQKKSYTDFYKLNLDNDIPIVKPICQVTGDIERFLKIRLYIAKYARKRFGV